MGHMIFLCPTHPSPIKKHGWVGRVCVCVSSSENTYNIVEITVGSCQLLMYLGQTGFSSRALIFGLTVRLVISEVNGI